MQRKHTQANFWTHQDEYLVMQGNSYTAGTNHALNEVQEEDLGTVLERCGQQGHHFRVVHLLCQVEQSTHHAQELPAVHTHTAHDIHVQLW